MFSIAVAGEWMQDCVGERTAHPELIHWFLLDVGFGQVLRDMGLADVGADLSGISENGCRIGCSLWECWSMLGGGDRLPVSAWRKKELLWLSSMEHFHPCKAALWKVCHFCIIYSLSLLYITCNLHSQATHRIVIAHNVSAFLNCVA